MTMTNWAESARNIDIDVRNFVNGKYIQHDDEKTMSKYSPRDGSLLYKLNQSSTQQTSDAVKNARAAFDDGRWSKRSSQERKQVLYTLATLIEEHTEELALLECLDVGKPISEALAMDLPAAAGVIRYCAEAADKVFGIVQSSDSRCLTYESRKPLGVIAGIIGWNFPLLLAAMKIGPSLAMGNSLVLKPSEITSLSAARIAELAVEAGVPEGVFNVVHGTGAETGSILAHHEDVNLLTFTGSTQIGKQLMIAAGNSNMKRLILECGGKTPSIVFDDCPDLDGVADAVLSKAYWNQGEVCAAGSRLLIQESIKEELLSKIVERTAKLTPGDPLNPATNFGALISESHKEKVLSYIQSGREEGAKLIYGEPEIQVNNGGYYVNPAIFDDVNPAQKIAQEEIFGPVLSVMSFRDEADALSIANSTIFGLTTNIWTRDLGRAHRVSQGIDAGLVSVYATTTPSPGPAFGSMSLEAQKESGFGKETGLDGLKSFTASNTIQIFV